MRYCQNTVYRDKFDAVFSMSPFGNGPCEGSWVPAAPRKNRQAESRKATVLCHVVHLPVGFKDTLAFFIISISPIHLVEHSTRMAPLPWAMVPTAGKWLADQASYSTRARDTTGWVTSPTTSQGQVKQYLWPTDGNAWMAPKHLTTFQISLSLHLYMAGHASTLLLQIGNETWS